MKRSIGFGFAIIVTEAVLLLAGVHSYSAEMTLAGAAVVGVGTVVAMTRVRRPFLLAAVVSSVTVLCAEVMAFAAGVTELDVLPGPGMIIVMMGTLSLIAGGWAGAVAVGIRGLRSLF